MFRLEPVEATVDASPGRRDAPAAPLAAIGKRPIGQITPAEVQALVKRWVGERKASSVTRDYRTLAAIFNYAVEQEFIARSPCRKVKLPKGSQRQVHVVDSDELATLAKAMGEYGPMAFVAAVLGLRWGEVAGLRVGRLDLHDRVLVVAEQVTRGKGGQIFLGAPKSDASRLTLELYAQSVPRLDREAARALGEVFMPDA